MTTAKETNKENLRTLYQAVLELKTEDECKCFFDDICTIAELHALGQRIEVAKMLNADRTYQQILNDTGASTATISRVNRCLRYGENGYQLVLGRMDAKTDTISDKGKD